MTSKINNIIKCLLLVIASITLCLIIVEFCVRFVTVKYFRESHARFFEYHSILGWINKPDFSDIFKMTDSNSFVRINHKRLRSDDDIPYERKQKPRIAILGDSFTWGIGVDNGKRFSDILQNHYFNNAVEVINAGVVGYGTDQELLFYELEIRKYKPDIVILAFTFTDVGDISSRNGKPFYTINKQDNLELKNVPVPKALDRERQSKVSKKPLLSAKDIKVLQIIRQGVVSIPIITDWYINDKIYNGEINLKLAEMLIKTIKSKVEEEGASFLVLMIPSYGDIIRGRHNVVFKKLFAFFDKNNIEYLLLLDIFINNKDKNPYLKFDKHFSENGHSIAAMAIYSHFKENTNKYLRIIEK